MDTKKWKSVLTEKEFLSNVLKSLRESEMTQRELSLLIEISETHMSYTLSGLRPKALLKLAKFFGYERRLIRVKDKG